MGIDGGFHLIGIDHRAFFSDDIAWIEKIGFKPASIEVVYEGLNELKPTNRTTKEHKDIDKKMNNIKKLDQSISKLVKLYKNNY